jgi:hypothetical protein
MSMLNSLNKLKANRLKSGDAAGGAMVGIAGVACVACCAAPIAGVLAGIGLTTAIAAKIFGVAALVIGVAVALVMLRRRRNWLAGVDLAPLDALQNKREESAEWIGSVVTERFAGNETEPVVEADCCGECVG